jgi:membrane associated rhomboid family serine protease
MDRYYYKQVRFGPGSIGPVVRSLIIANVAVFIIQSAVASFTSYNGWMLAHFGMTPVYFIRAFHLWQPVTYMFMHGGLFHLLMNMFVLWMFGMDVERRMGSRTFAIFYFFCGIGAGLLTCVFLRNWDIPTIGASGAIFGVMLAFGLMFPDRIILVFFVLPMRAFYFVLLLGLFELYYLVFGLRGGISYSAHVGGMLFGYLFLRYSGKIMGFVDEKTGRIQATRKLADLERSEDAQRRVDTILDKINREGIHKLSRAERNFLREHARRNHPGRPL